VSELLPFTFPTVSALVVFAVGYGVLKTKVATNAKNIERVEKQVLDRLERIEDKLDDALRR
jgi:hypothetical protein